MAALPNPNKRNEKTLGFLKDTLDQQTETNKWSRNVDTNTYRSMHEQEKLTKSFSSNIGTIIKNQNLANDDEKGKFRTMFENILKPFDDLRIADSFKEFSKTFGEGGPWSNWKEPFKDIGHSLVSLSAELTDAKTGASNFGKGFKELTNGIGSFGPVMNTFKNFLHKLVGAFNLLYGTLQIIGGAFKTLILKPLWILFKAFRFIGRGIMAMFGNKKAAGRVKQSYTDLKDKVDTKVKKGSNLLHKTTRGWFGTAAEEEGGEGGDGEGGNLDGSSTERMEELLEAIHNTLLGQAQPKNTMSAEEADKALADAFSDGSSAEEEAEEEKMSIWKKMQVKGADLKQKFLKNEFVQRKTNDMKIFAIQKANEAKKFMMHLLKFLLPIIALGAAFLYLKDKISSWAEAPFAGIAKAGEIVVKKIGSIFSSLKAGLAKMFPKLFAPKVDPKPKPKPKVDVKPKPGGAASGAASTADDAVKGGARAMAKTVGKGVLKRIPLIGAAAEGAIDAKQNEDKFARIKEAYENQTPIIEDETTGELRPLTKEEFEAAEQSMTANRAGSAGRTGGAWAGAATGAAAGAAIGSVIPFVGTAIGGIIGGVLGGFWGARKGDEIATNLANNTEGVEDPQAYIDNLANNLPDLANEQGVNLETANIDVADASSMAGDGSGGGGNSVASIDNSSRTDINYESEGDMDDSQLSYSGSLG